MRLDAMRRMTKSGLRRKNLLRLSNLLSMASRDENRSMKKRGRKLMNYREVTK